MVKKWGERRGSNPRQPGPQPGALPTELRSPYFLNLDPREIRTPDRLLRRQLLYPAELPGQNYRDDRI